MPYTYVSQKSSVVTASAIMAKFTAYWKLDEASGTNRVDATGNGNTLVNNGTVGQDTQLGVNNATWNGNTANYLLASDSATLSMGNFDFALCGWFRVPDVAGTKVLFSKGDDNAAAAETEYLVQVFGNILQFFMSDHTTRSLVTTGASLVANTNYFWVAWYEQAIDTMWIQLNDGTPFQLNPVAVGCWNGPNTLTMGRWNNFAGGPMNGGQAGVGISKTLFSEAERTFLYNGGVPLIWPF